MNESSLTLALNPPSSYPNRRQLLYSPCPISKTSPNLTLRNTATGNNQYHQRIIGVGRPSRPVHSQRHHWSITKQIIFFLVRPNGKEPLLTLLTFKKKHNERDAVEWASWSRLEVKSIVEMAKSRIGQLPPPSFPFPPDHHHHDHHQPRSFAQQGSMAAIGHA